MLANVHMERLSPRTRVLLMGSTGGLVAIVATLRVFLPTLSLLAQSSQAQITLLLELFSPLLSFVIMGGGMGVVLWCIEPLFPPLAGRTLAPGHIRSAPRQALPAALPPQEPHKQAVVSSDRSVEDLTRNLYASARRVGVPPLFQLDPSDPNAWANRPTYPPGWHPPIGRPPAKRGMQQEAGKEAASAPVAGAQVTTPAGTLPFDLGAYTERAGSVEEERAQKEAVSTQPEEKEAVSTQSEERSVSQAVAAASPQLSADEQPKSVSAGALRRLFPLSEQREQTAKPVTITLLKQVRAWVRADDGTVQEVKLRGGENAIRLIQLAYIAWRQGTSVDRDKLFTYVLSRGKRREMTTDQLGEVFDAAKRYLRRDLARAVHELELQGHPVSGEIDFFANEPGFYWLHPCCRIADLEQIETYAQTIQLARKEGLLDEKLDGSLPGWVLEACQKLVEAYAGDFLQSLLEKFPEEFGAWVKEPITLYRDRYLEALLILAKYESAQGKNVGQQEGGDFAHQEEQRRSHSGRAAQLFYDYAMSALNCRWDQKLKFAYRAGKDGERVVRAARAMRRCVVELGKLGNPDMIDQAYLAFKERMSLLSEGTWKPDQDTESDVAEAKRTTSAYRFVLQTQQRVNAR